MAVITDTGFLGMPMFRRGKVRDIYEVGDDLLIISTDRISAFDVIMDEGIPGKGEVLNRLAAFWFEKTADIIENHMLTCDMSVLPPEFAAARESLQGRSMLVRKAEPLPVECVARGYLAGSGWKDYRATGSLCGISLPPGLLQADRLPEPLFTPSTKAELGTHDENITFDAVIEEVGTGMAERLSEVSLALYERGREIAEERGIILADTKYEFGTFEGRVILIDEIHTPDSSRFWPMETWEPGRDQDNLDKQVLRDWLETTGWDKKPPPPTLPPEIIERTAERYRYIKELLLVG
ncbi:MAG: phosphoribosylaminoimidazolesuccinocarboxamide synthase [Actinobacteria bacterium]|nr:phosphoribosylaminoimidazolesuccinocarboxamide synthase [Actinomycetota bacterium]MBU1945082.1 phosphoribosylaminoimidazolesuccinocarboxamide synthase [Actinomycetota bacterium]MBU2688351.1 phosphoribosylaminoimidazolesuccinocarboxamide synthase [Actinomycetota bacterium]